MRVNNLGYQLVRILTALQRSFRHFFALPSVPRWHVRTRALSRAYSIMSIVRTETEWILYQDAQNRPEYASTRFWEYYFQGWFPTRDEWVLASQQPPHPGSLRKVEMTIEIMRNHRMFTLMIYEAKRTKSSMNNLDDVEGQVFSACQAHLAHNNRNRMYGARTVGTAIKFWIIDAEKDYLEPWHPASGDLSMIGEYLQAHSTDGAEIEQAIREMKSNLLCPQHKIKFSKASPTLL